VARTKKISQTQLAKELGISQALVSLVLNGRRQGINAETYDRIWAIATKKGYRPKGMSSAASAESIADQIGVIYRSSLKRSSPGNYFLQVEQGLHNALIERGYSTVFMGSEDTLNRARLGKFFTEGHRFRGIVLMGEVEAAFLNDLRRFEKRIVANSARYPGICHSVVGNEPQALEALVVHLVGLGHRRIGWLGGNVDLGRHESRFNAFKAALSVANIELDARYTITLEQADRAEGFEAAHTMLKHRKDKEFPTAFVCYNTLMAQGALKAFEREGLLVPDDLSIASADASAVATMQKPYVTAAGTSPEKLGEAAARLVLQSTGEESDTFIDMMLPAPLIKGDSTARVKSA
jgi:LacI family transcriptional regulator